MSRVNLGAGAVKKAVKATTKKLKKATARNKPYETGAKLRKVVDDMEKSYNKRRKARGLKELTEKDFKSQAEFFKERYRRYSQNTGLPRAERSAFRKKVKEDMKDGTFAPENPQVHIQGLGVYNLKLLEKVIKRDLGKAINDLGYESGAKNLNYHLYQKRSPLGSKIQGLWEVYQQMNSPQYKRAITMYKKKR